jgi:hypothetical protein
MNLYRGDNIFNARTTPELFRFDGLMSGSFGKGDPAYVQKNGLLKSIRQHIRQFDSTDREYYQRSDFFSFSMDRQRAEYWLTNRNSIQIEKCINEYDETRYLFIMDIKDSELLFIEKGIYSYNFRCNTKLKRPNGNSLQEQVLVGYDTGCPICDLGQNHQVIFINSIEYLMANPADYKVADALSAAIEDSEWMLLSNDYFGRLKSSRIPRADFWRAELYKGSGETRNMNEFSIKGKVV